jgi:parallel beta-helix repeat protein
MSERSIPWFAFAIGFLLFLVWVTPTTVSDNIDLKSDFGLVKEDSALIAYIPHAPIYIDGDTNFTDTALLEGWQGNGTLEDPFIIENLSITSGGSATPRVNISNTRVHFVIQNCELAYASSSRGLNLDNVHNGRIINNTCTGNYFGIYLVDSWYNTIVDNNCSFNQYGMSIDYSWYNTIINNICSNNPSYGIHLWHSPHTTVDNCTLIDNYRGILVDDSDYSTIANNNVSGNVMQGIFVQDSSQYVNLENNTCNNNFRGIYHMNSYYSTLVNNTCNYNADYGIYFSSSHLSVINNSGTGNSGGGLFANGGFHTIANNNFSYNLGSGIYFDAGTDGTLTNNTCDGNGDSGMYFTNLDNTNVTNNECNNNNDHGIHVGPYTLENNVTQNICRNNDGVAGSRGVLVDYYSINNTISWNVFEDNSVDAEDGQYSAYDDNVYDYNYYSDYAGVDANGNGIGDTPHTISGSAGHSDAHPLMFRSIPFRWNETPRDQTITDLDVLYYKLNITAYAPVTWSVNDVVHFTIDENGTLEPIGALAFGEYELMVNVTNIYNFTIQAEFTIYVVPWDTTPPDWVITPEDQVIEYGDPFYYDLDVTDSSAISHWWLTGGGFSIDSDGVITNSTFLAVNIYIIIINVNDTYGNTRGALIAITVEDTILPSWVIAPENQVIEYGEHFTYDVDATDLAGIDNWWLNTTDFEIDGNGVITNATVLAAGSYGLEISCNDTHGNVLSATITVTVEELPSTTTPTTDTTTPTSPTTPTGNTPGGLDPMLFIALGGIGGVVVLIIVILFVKKKS